jgi:hypothetical protein
MSPPSDHFFSAYEERKSRASSQRERTDADAVRLPEQQQVNSSSMIMSRCARMSHFQYRLRA